MKLVTFATAPDQLTAEMWRDIVRQAGLTCELQPGDTASFLGLSQFPVRLMTSEPEAEEARSILSGSVKAPPGSLPDRG